MEVLSPRCAGFDVHKKTVKVCLFVQEDKASPKKILRTYKTMTADLLEIRDWLAEQGCTHIAMEATGVYTPIDSMATWVHSALVSQSPSAKISLVMVVKYWISF